VIIEPSHFEYLSIQRGEVSDKLALGFDAWKLAYLASLKEIAESIWKFLPEKCDRVLDVGSGLGGIDLLLSRRYKTAHFDLLDGTDYKPYVYNHNVPFSNSGVALDFHHKNGNDRVECVWPKVPVDRTYDLVVSFAAWCFHISPINYLDGITRASHDKTRLIIEVRRERKDWLTALVKAFGRPVVLAKREKFVRLGFRCETSSSLPGAGASVSTQKQQT